LSSFICCKISLRPVSSTFSSALPAPLIEIISQISRATMIKNNMDKIVNDIRILYHFIKNYHPLLVIPVETGTRKMNPRIREDDRRKKDKK
jgi:hypothetical protein